MFKHLHDMKLLMRVNLQRKHLFLMYCITSFLTEWHTGLCPIPRSHHTCHPLLLAHVARRSAQTSWSVAEGPSETDPRLETMGFSAHHDVPESICVLLHGLSLDKGQRSSGHTERGAGVGRGTPQWLFGHAGTQPSRPAYSGVALREQKPAGYRR